MIANKEHRNAKDIDYITKIFFYTDYRFRTKILKSYYQK